MKIHMKNVSINLELDEFLTILEEDAFEDLLVMIVDLDETVGNEGYEEAINKHASLIKPPPTLPRDLKARPYTDEEIDAMYDEMEEEEVAMEQYGAQDKEAVLSMISEMFDGDTNFGIAIYEIPDDPGADYAIDYEGYPHYDGDGMMLFSEEDFKVNRIVNRFIGLVE